MEGEGEKRDEEGERAEKKAHNTIVLGFRQSPNDPYSEKDDWF